MPDAATQQVLIQVHHALVQLARQGGYIDAVMQAGSELDRLKAYLEVWEGRRSAPPARPGQAPVLFPPFPGLEERPWRDPASIPEAAALERHFPAVLEDLERLEQADLVNYSTGIVQGGQWSVLPIYLAGERVDRLFRPERALDATAAAVESLAGQCAAFPLSDVLFSAHTPGTRLTPHCSWDGFRMRLHLGLTIPPGCGIRVGTESRTWEPGRVLAFHDSFEHETWNTGEGRRVVLIADCWHPGLTVPEREALLALTRKFEVRRILALLRIPDSMEAPLMARFAEAERDDPLLQRFWRT
ncbi:aspartyl/asparaginyl beta-hydroxylase domain-containing protein [Stigmatella hybrida]|uniref:aspartyl/asparaginyl beta-hydroxylase domain-containing protein n=1 Tax=Stigmatella hybrida TaxID=394097 RepID=UPI001CDACDB2|nr:aspartyl/asparaginyl beta-hydroxylase domain-containing protein [Stigmatella hybrida]